MQLFSCTKCLLTNDKICDYSVVTATKQIERMYIYEKIIRLHARRSYAARRCSADVLCR